MSATRSIFGELAIDVALAADANWHARDHFEHVGWTWSSADGTKENLDLSVRLVDSVIGFDVPVAQPSANHDATFHARSIARMPQRSDKLGEQRATRGK
jgi:hypothetical protein